MALSADAGPVVEGGKVVGQSKPLLGVLRDWPADRLLSPAFHLAGVPTKGGFSVSAGRTWFCVTSQTVPARHAAHKRSEWAPCKAAVNPKSGPRMGVVLNMNQRLALAAPIRKAAIRRMAPEGMWRQRTKVLF